MTPAARSFPCAALVLCLVVSCAELPPVEVPQAPPPAPVPAELKSVSIYVHRYQHRHENDDDKYDYSHMPGFTSDLRAAFGVALAKAGYTVVVDRQTPADVTALIYEEWESLGNENEPQPDGVATLTLRSRAGAIIDRFSVPVPAFGRGYRAKLWQSRAAVDLIAAMSRSEALAELARKQSERTSLTVAAQDDSPPAAKVAPQTITYEDAVKDAEEARPEEISTDLVPILPTNPSLSWKTEGGKQRVLMVTWTSYTGYDPQVGKSISIDREVWVTAAPFVANFCKGKGENLEALTLRLEQLLGLPKGDKKDRFVSVWAEPKDVFRPCPDPEITDRECGVDFPESKSFVTVSRAHIEWFEKRRKASYGEGGYPWTRLGYTYDWAGPVVGMSEFVIRKGANVVVEGVQSTAEYCR